MALNIDADELNSDWMRAAVWDLPRDPKVLLFNIGVNRWEHFKTLPAFKAIPEGLEAKVDELVRARKASNPDLVKYDEDQPRDELGRFGSGGGNSFGAGNGGHNLPLRDLPRSASGKSKDFQKNKIYAAEDVLMDKGAPPEKVVLAKDLSNLPEYAQYAKDFNAWASIPRDTIISDVAKENLDGTIEGAENYIREVTSSQFFKDNFGDQSNVPEYKVVPTEIKGNVIASHLIGVRNGEEVNQFKISEKVFKDEPTLLHEVAHYATSLDVNRGHAAHGGEFAQNYLRLVDHVMGPEYGKKLSDRYDSLKVKRYDY